MKNFRHSLILFLTSVLLFSCGMNQEQGKVSFTIPAETIQQIVASQTVAESSSDSIFSSDSYSKLNFTAEITGSEGYTAGVKKSVDMDNKPAAVSFNFAELPVSQQYKVSVSVYTEMKGDNVVYTNRTYYGEQSGITLVPGDETTVPLKIAAVNMLDIITYDVPPVEALIKTSSTQYVNVSNRELMEDEAKTADAYALPLTYIVAAKAETSLLPNATIKITDQNGDEIPAIDIPVEQKTLFSDYTLSACQFDKAGKYIVSITAYDALTHAYGNYSYVLYLTATELVTAPVTLTATGLDNLSDYLVNYLGQNNSVELTLVATVKDSIGTAKEVSKTLTYTSDSSISDIPSITIAELSPSETYSADLRLKMNYVTEGCECSSDIYIGSKEDIKLTAGSENQTEIELSQTTPVSAMVMTDPYTGTSNITASSKAYDTMEYPVPTEFSENETKYDFPLYVNITVSTKGADTTEDSADLSTTITVTTPNGQTLSSATAAEAGITGSNYTENFYKCDEYGTYTIVAVSTDKATNAETKCTARLSFVEIAESTTPETTTGDEVYYTMYTNNYTDGGNSHYKISTIKDSKESLSSESKIETGNETKNVIFYDFVTTEDGTTYFLNNTSQVCKTGDPTVTPIISYGLTCTKLYYDSDTKNLYAISSDDNVGIWNKSISAPYSTDDTPYDHFIATASFSELLDSNTYPDNKIKDFAVNNGNLYLLYKITDANTGTVSYIIAVTTISFDSTTDETSNSTTYSLTLGEKPVIVDISSKIEKAATTESTPATITKYGYPVNDLMVVKNSGNNSDDSSYDSTLYCIFSSNIDNTYTLLDTSDDSKNAYIVNRGGLAEINFTANTLSTISEAEINLKFYYGNSSSVGSISTVNNQINLYLYQCDSDSLSSCMINPVKFTGYSNGWLTIADDALLFSSAATGNGIIFQNYNRIFAYNGIESRSFVTSTYNFSTEKTDDFTFDLSDIEKGQSITITYSDGSSSSTDDTTTTGSK